VRMQATPNSAHGGMWTTARHLLASDGLVGFYAGFGPLLLRQVPVAAIQLSCLEATMNWLFDLMPRDRHLLVGGEKVFVLFWASTVLGMFSALVTQPADTLFSHLATLPHRSGFVKDAVAVYRGTPETPGLGFFGLFAGGGTRMVTLGGVCGLQLFCYGLLRVYLGVQSAVFR